MTNNPTTVAELFARDPMEIAETILVGDTGARIAEAIREADLVWETALATITDEDLSEVIFAMLSRPLADLLRSSWNELVELQEYLDIERHPPEETSKVGVAKHKLKIDWEPKLDVRINGQTVREISFDLSLVLSVEDSVLTIRNGRIWEATGPRIRGEAKLSCEGFLISRKLIEKVQLPAKIQFGDGLPIPDLIG